MIPLFFLNIALTFFLLDKLHLIIKLSHRKLTYIKSVSLFVLCLIYIWLILILTGDIYIKFIYIGLFFINFVFCIFIIGKQEKEKSEITDKEVFDSWKACAKKLNCEFKIRIHNNIKIPVIYGNIKKFYVEIFPFVKKLSNKLYDHKLNTLEPKKAIVIRVFNKSRNNENIDLFSYERKFNESSFKNYSYIESYIEPDWSDKNIPELPEEFSIEVDNMIKKSIRSIPKT
ncbi:MAG: hypothetical protein ACOCV8_01605 [Spirochaetota bacterium]